MTDIVIPREELPVVTGPDADGFLTCDGERFSPATSLKLARLWARRYLAIEEHLEAVEEQAAQVTDEDRALAINARDLYGKAVSKLTDKELEGVTKMLDLQQKLGEVPGKEEEPSKDVVAAPDSVVDDGGEVRAEPSETDTKAA